MLESLRHVPLLMWAAVQDELVPYSGTREQAMRLGSLGYAFGFDSFPTAEHVTLALNDDYGPAAEFLGDGRVERDPGHVSYVVNPTMDDPEHGLVGDHAYWLSGLRTRGPGLGRIDVRSEGLGAGAPGPAPAVERSGGVLTAGAKGPLAYTHEGAPAAEAPAVPRRDRLVVSAENVRTATVDARRAKVSCDAAIELRSDGPLDLRFAGCPLFASAPPAGRCLSKRRFGIRLRRVRGVRSARVTVDGRRVAVRRRRGRLVATVDLRGKPKKVVVVRITLVVRRDGRKRRLSDTRRYRTCTPGPR
jgi:hypothetical protein